MSEIEPFYKHFIKESLKKWSLTELHDNDMNKAAYEINDIPVDITPRAIKEEL